MTNSRSPAPRCRSALSGTIGMSPIRFAGGRGGERRRGAEGRGGGEISERISPQRVRALWCGACGDRGAERV